MSGACPQRFSLKGQPVEKDHLPLQHCPSGWHMEQSMTGNLRTEESLNVFVQKRRGSMYLEEETSKKLEVISCIFSLKEEVGALAKALRLFEVNRCTNS